MAIQQHDMVLCSLHRHHWSWHYGYKHWFEKFTKQYCNHSCSLTANVKSFHCGSSSSSRWLSTSKSWGLTLRICKRFRCKQCCCSVVLILKTGLIRPTTQGRVATSW